MSETKPQVPEWPPRVRFFENNDDGSDYEILNEGWECPDVLGEYLSLAEHQAALKRAVAIAMSAAFEAAAEFCAKQGSVSDRIISEMREAVRAAREEQLGEK